MINKKIKPRKNELTGGTTSMPYSSLDEELVLRRLGGGITGGGCNDSVERYRWRGLAVFKDWTQG